MEKVQRKDTKMIKAFIDKDYYNRLQALNLTTLQTRCIREDLLKCLRHSRALKIWTLSVSLRNQNLVFKVMNSGWLSPEQDWMLDNFSVIAVQKWNKLPVQCQTVSKLKKETGPSPQI